MTHDCASLLKQAFRESLEKFYAALQLAPPYHSIEKAITLLSVTLQSKTGEELQAMYATPLLRRKIFQQAFVESGLTNKHRGIILACLQSKDHAGLQDEQKMFLAAFQT